MNLNILTQSLWRDEAFSVLLAEHSLTDIVRLTAQDVTPPLYYFLLHFWMRIFGTSEISIRLLSSIFHLLTAVAVYYLAKRLFDHRVGFIASLLILLNPFLFTYAFEARPYSLLTLLATLSMYFFYSQNWPLYILTTILGLYSHNFMILLLPVQLLLLFSNSHELENGKRSATTALIAITLGYLPWLPILIRQTQQVSGGFWIETFGLGDVRSALVHYLTGIQETPFKIPLLVLFAFLVGLTIYQQKNVKCQMSNVKFLLFWFLVPTLLTSAVSLFKPIFHERYLIYIVVPLMMGVAVGCQSIKVSKYQSILLFAICSLLFLPDLYILTHPQKAPIRETVNSIAQNFREGDLIINESPLTFLETKYYLRYNDPRLKKAHFVQGPWENIPFYVGAILIPKNQVLDQLPQEGRFFLIKDSGGVELQVLSDSGP